MNPFQVYKSVLNRYIDAQSAFYLESAWNEPHRKYHNINHLNSILEYIEDKRFGLNIKTYEVLVLAAFFHDAHYNPRDKKSHEDESIKKFLSSYIHKDEAVKNMVIQMIDSTRHRKIPLDDLVRLFWNADNAGFYKGYDELVKNEHLIRQEFIFVMPDLYKKGRIDFLKSNLGLFNNKVDKDLKKLIEFVNKKY